MYRSVIIIFLLLIQFGLSAQEQQRFRYADSITYELYLDKNWDDLIMKGKEALSNGHDYYYMRMRIGIAYYEKHNYAMASLHFKKALEFNSSDQVAIEYQFYSAFLSNRIYEAWAILSTAFPETRNRIIEESRFRKNTMAVESFYSNFSTDDLLTSPGDNFIDPEPGCQSITRYTLNNSIYASHILGNKFAYLHSFTNFLKDSYLHYYDGVSAADIPDHKLMQNQYYGAFNFNSPKGWSFTPAFHILFTSYSYPYRYGSGMNSGLSSSVVTDIGYVSSLRINRSGGFLSIGAEAGFSELNYLMQAQGGVSLNVYPLGNTNLYLGGTLSVIFPLEENQESPPVITGITTGFSISKKVWFEFSGSDGFMKNYIENNGLFVFNGSDILKRKISGRLIVPFNKPGISFYVGAGRSWYSSEWIPEDGINSTDANIINYFSNNLTGGISWKF